MAKNDTSVKIYRKKLHICFWKNSCLLNKTDQFPLKKFNFSMAVSQTSMKTLKKG